MKRTLVIYNQGSGRKRWLRLLYTIKRGLPKSDFDLTFRNFENFKDSHTDLRNKKFDLVVIAGGGGTIRQVVSWLLNEKLDLPIGLIPIGAANMLAQSLYIPLWPWRALKVIRRGHSQYIDIGLINDKYYFLEAFAVGYLSERIIKAEKRLKTIFGFGSYLLSFLMRRQMPLHHFRFSIDGQTYQQDGNSLFIVNSTRLFGFKSKRASDMQDGKFELSVATNRNFRGFVEATYYYYFHQAPPRHLFIKDGGHFTLELPADGWPQIDGDYLNIPDQQLKIEVLPKKLAFIGNYANKDQ